MSMFQFSAATHVGRVRRINEDSILSLPEQRIWLVSDGMGGHSSGDFASQTIVEAVATLPADLPPGDMMRAVREAIHNAHRIILQAAEDRGVSTIGATVVALMLTDSHFVAFWAGDSRLYRLRNGEIELLTTDHSVVADLVLAGQMTWDEAELHPSSNAITRAVGVGEELELDKIRGEVLEGDRFLLCTDGLNKYTTMKMLEDATTEAPIATVADSLLQIALDAGGADNISLIVVDVA